MVDLKGQYSKIENEINESVLSVLKSSAFINGPEVKSFQWELEQYLGIKHVIPCANGTDALQIVMMALDLKPGDEVITADFTYVATAEVIALLGLTPVLVDVYPGTFTINIDEVKNVITSKTKAIVPVHLFGQCAEMEPLKELAEQHNLYIIEDAAQSIGTDYIYKSGKKVKAGTIGNAGCVSFFPSKNLGCYGDGGAIFTNNDELAKRLRMITNHGQSVQYHHDMVGVNSRLDSIQAAILRIKLKYLDNYAASRQKAAAFYDQAFANHSGLMIPERSKNSTHVFHQYTLQIEGGRRNKLKDYLATKDIPSMIYYPIPLHLQKAFGDKRYKQGTFPITEALCDKVLSLPIHTELNEEIQGHITREVLDFLTM